MLVYQQGGYMQPNELIGQLITVYMVGGHVIRGKVDRVSDMRTMGRDGLVVKRYTLYVEEKGQYTIVFLDQIAAITIGTEHLVNDKKA